MIVKTCLLEQHGQLTYAIECETGYLLPEELREDGIVSICRAVDLAGNARWSVDFTGQSPDMWDSLLFCGRDILSMLAEDIASEILAEWYEDQDVIQFQEGPLARHELRNRVQPELVEDIFCPFNDLFEVRDPYDLVVLDEADEIARRIRAEYKEHFQRRRKYENFRKSVNLPVSTGISYWPAEVVALARIILKCGSICYECRIGPIGFGDADQYMLVASTPRDVKILCEASDQIDRKAVQIATLMNDDMSVTVKGMYGAL